MRLRSRLPSRRQRPELPGGPSHDGGRPDLMNELEPPPAKSGHRSLLELVLIVAAALAFALVIQAVLVKPYRIPSESMEPTLDVGERVLVSRVNYHVSDPDRGDIVVFHPPSGAEGNRCGAVHPPDQACPRPTPDESEVNFIKRIVAVPGDTLSIRDGHAIVNGKQQDDSFTKPCAGVGQCDYPRPIKIPPGHFFMMGDNRGESDDSRFWGPVPEDSIIGQAFFTYWPIKRIGPL
jgi:signal peptidase I